ncbi:MAG: segregation/condensation protein A [Planctomycetes bacterium]|nr:segregation/condensation protein A [Planctomycetota bacterium]
MAPERESSAAWGPGEPEDAEPVGSGAAGAEDALGDGGEGYRVELDVFTGPLDLLLYLIRKEEIDIYDIPISRILDQFLGHLEVLCLMELDDVGDFLVMASQLMLIKARMLVPQQVDLAGEEEEELEDPRRELVQRLLEYKRFKEAALKLEARRAARSLRFERGPDREPEAGQPDEEPGTLEVELWDLVEAFARIVREVGSGHELIPLNREDLPMHVYTEEIIGRLHRTGKFYLEALLEGVESRYRMVSYFLAILELVRAGRLRARQEEPFGRILLERPMERAAGSAPAAVPAAPAMPVFEAAEDKATPVFEAGEATDVLHETAPRADRGGGAG